MKLDCAYSEKVFPSDIFASNGGMIFNESIIAVYVDLDRLIDTAPLSHKQRAILQLLMRGYTIQDIADISQQDQSNISHIYSRALKTLVAHHNERWRSVTTNNLRMDVD